MQRQPWEVANHNPLRTLPSNTDAGLVSPLEHPVPSHPLGCVHSQTYSADAITASLQYWLSLVPTLSCTLHAASPGTRHV
ncbi:hypothetical protein N7478_001831 [Penicillium angulare]|uniref:uncharacterized protein n=1 Tax=Penicillium angulare TaxID=116970 RepID=UPI002541AE2F|nr:uncharacterized protein N7478_001831 [Penicillium angulare]KAJ5288801.1 hypothetical protein N7478_001831 [Penicillium angulare]